MKKEILFAFSLLISALTMAQQSDVSSKTLRYSNKFTIGTDLAQPFILGGLNLNGTYTTNRWIFDYSHGIGLEIPDFIKTDEQENLNAHIEIPWTTGPGVGYRWTDNLDTRIDFKAHRTEVNLLNGQQELEYTQFTMGPGVYYRFYLGTNTGFGLEASARYWFDLGNTQDGLNGDDFQFSDNNDVTQSFDTNINSGVGVNVALIYTFGRNKQR
ncbi:MAG: hypothetical protein AAFU57_04690 [Bacteroidota bacterium]